MLYGSRPSTLVCNTELYLKFGFKDCLLFFLSNRLSSLLLPLIRHNWRWFSLSSLTTPPFLTIRESSGFCLTWKDGVGKEWRTHSSSNVWAKPASDSQQWVLVSVVCLRATDNQVILLPHKYLKHWQVFFYRIKSPKIPHHTSHRKVFFGAWLSSLSVPQTGCPKLNIMPCVWNSKTGGFSGHIPLIHPKTVLSGWQALLVYTEFRLTYSHLS